MNNIEDILKNIDNCAQEKSLTESEQLDENGVTNFIGNVANKVFKGQSFAQSNANRAQKAIDKQNSIDANAKKQVGIASQAVTILDNIGDKNFSTVGKSADDVIKFIQELPQLIQNYKDGSTEAKNAGLPLKQGAQEQGGQNGSK